MKSFFTFFQLQVGEVSGPSQTYTDTVVLQCPFAENVRVQARANCFNLCFFLGPEKKTIFQVNLFLLGGRNPTKVVNPQKEYKSRTRHTSYHIFVQHTLIKTCVSTIRNVVEHPKNQKDRFNFFGPTAVQITPYITPEKN